MKPLFSLIIVLLIRCFIPASQVSSQALTANSITPGADRINVYLPLIKGKKVGIFANHTSMVGNTHLVDTLRKLGVDIRVIFGPEHGFRGTTDMCKIETGAASPPTPVTDGLCTSGDSLLEWTPALIQ